MHNSNDQRPRPLILSKHNKSESTLLTSRASQHAISTKIGSLKVLWWPQLSLLYNKVFLLLPAAATDSLSIRVGKKVFFHKSQN
jgi:hypothetical protein